MALSKRNELDLVSRGTTITQARAIARANRERAAAAQIKPKDDNNGRNVPDDGRIIFDSKDENPVL